MTKSTSEMKLYKYFLLNIAIWAILFDFWVNIIFAPLELFPAPAICVEGLAKYVIEVMHKRGTMLPAGVFLGGSVSSEWVAFYYRYRTLQGDDNDFWRKKKVIIAMVVFHFILPVPCLAIIYPAIMFYQSTDELTYIKEHYPYTIRIVDPRGPKLCGAMNIDENPLTGLFIGFSFAYFVIIAAGGIGATSMLIKRIDKQIKFLKMANTSSRTVEMQGELTRALRIQIIIPIMIMFVPYIAMMPIVIFKWTWLQGLFYSLHFLSSLHSFFNALSMICLIKPYKQTVIKWMPLKWLTCRRFPNSMTVQALQPSIQSSSLLRPQSSIHVR